MGICRLLARGAWAGIGIGEAIPAEWENTLDGLLSVAEPEPSEFGKREKVYVAGVDVRILSERRQFLDAEGHLITTGLKEYTKSGIVRSYRTLDSFLQSWNEAEKK